MPFRMRYLSGDDPPKANSGYMYNFYITIGLLESINTINANLLVI